MNIQSINPIFKKGDKSDPSNYRPISLTSHLIKIFEQVIRQKIVSHLEANDLLSRNHHGFRKGQSCLTHLKHIDDVIKIILNGNEHDVIYLDFAKAFDKVDHEILLQMLKICGITGKLFSWIEKFITNRHQFVNIKGFHSVLALVISCVPQGPVLGPKLFLIYINDLKKCLKSSSASSFADDTRLSQQITCCEDSSLLQDDLFSVVKWAEQNNMELYENKFELLTYYRTPRSKLLEELPFTSEWLEYNTPSGQVILPSKIVKDLGVYLSNDIGWSVQVNEAVQSANKMANWVLSVFFTRSESVMLTLFRSLVRSRLEYSCPVWNPSLLGDIKKLESTHRVFTRHISGCQDLCYWDRLKRLGLMSLQRRRERYITIHVWKTLHELAPNDIGIIFYEHIRLGTRCRIPP